MAAGKRIAAVWRGVRLLFVVLLFGWGLMVILPAPRMPLFYLTLLATEFGHWLAIAALVLVLAGSRRTPMGFAATLLGWLAVALFASSTVRASFLAGTLPQEFSEAFASLGYRAPDDATPPFAWSRLWARETAPRASIETMPFGSHAGGKLELDLYRCATRTPAPCVVVVHGGGWDGGRRTEFPEMNRFLAAHGYAVAAMDYQLAPKAPWPAQRDDVLAVLAYLRENAAALGIDASRIVLLGRSAGGQIAEAVAYTAHDPAIRGCIALYAPADLHFAFKYADPNDILNSLQLLRHYLGGTPETARANYDSASAILHVSRESVPTLLLHGRRDELVWFRQSERLAQSLSNAGAPHLFIELPWATHAFDYNLHGPGGQIAAWSITHFLDAVTNRE
jgi:acetyl esterase/lipase